MELAIYTRGDISSRLESRKQMRAEFVGLETEIMR